MEYDEFVIIFKRKNILLIKQQENHNPNFTAYVNQIIRNNMSILKYNRIHEDELVKFILQRRYYRITYPQSYILMLKKYIQINNELMVLYLLNNHYNISLNNTQYDYTHRRGWLLVNSITSILSLAFMYKMYNATELLIRLGVTKYPLTRIVRSDRFYFHVQYKKKKVRFIIRNLLKKYPYLCIFFINTSSIRRYIKPILMKSVLDNQIIVTKYILSNYKLSSNTKRQAHKIASHKQYTNMYMYLQNIHNDV